MCGELPLPLRGFPPLRGGLKASLQEGGGAQRRREVALIPFAKELRKNATKQEKHLWYDFLSSYPIRFQRQKAIDNFIVDFYCHQAKFVVEIDGDQHYTDKGLAYAG